jgi:predicted permease
VLGPSVLLLVFLLAGAAVQIAGAPSRLRDARVTFFWTFSPVLVFVTFSTVDLDEGLGRALVAAILASWLVGLAGYGYARLVAGERDERGALTLAAGFGNTGFVGYPLAQLAFGSDGLDSQCCTTGSPGWFRPLRFPRRSPACTAAALSR